MVVGARQSITADEFQAFTELPENLDKRFELVGGEIIEVPSNPYASKIAIMIAALLLRYLAENDLGHVTGADGGYLVNGELYAPDVAYISYERQPELAHKGYNQQPPEIAVEVISDPKNGQEQTSLRRKVANYLAAGVVVWVVNPEDRTIDIYEIGNTVQIFDETGTLTAERILPGFQLAVQEIFPQKTD